VLWNCLVVSPAANGFPGHGMPLASKLTMTLCIAETEEKGRDEE